MLQRWAAYRLPSSSPARRSQSPELPAPRWGAQTRRGAALVLFWHGEFSPRFRERHPWTCCPAVCRGQEGADSPCFLSRMLSVVSRPALSPDCCWEVPRRSVVPSSWERFPQQTRAAPLSRRVWCGPSPGEALGAFGAQRVRCARRELTSVFPLGFPRQHQPGSSVAGDLQHPAAGEDGQSSSSAGCSGAVSVRDTAGASPATVPAQGNQRRRLQEGGFDCRSALEASKCWWGSQWPCTQCPQHGAG